MTVEEAMNHTKKVYLDKRSEEWLEELQRYREIGTVEECQKAREREVAKELKLYGDFEDGKLLCPSCDEDLMDLVDCGFNNCPYCGQAID